MKKVLFVAIIATLIAVGCEKTEIINPNLGTEILFSPELGKLTKADEVAKDATLKAQGFKVSAINAYEDLYTTEPEFNTVYREMDNLQFIYGTNGWALQNGQSYFWPGTGKDLVFLAVSSKTESVEIPEIVENGFGITGTAVKDSEDNNTGAYSGITVNNFTIPNFTVTSPSYVKVAGENSNVGDQTGADDDLMVANVVIQNQGDNDGVVKGQVKLDFSHTLSKVQFVFTTNTTEDFPVTVNKVEIKDVINKATLGVGVSFANESRTSTNTYDWSPSSDDNDVNYLALKDDDETNKNYVDFVIDYNLSLDPTATEGLPYATWLVIPQSLEGKMVSITYTIADNNNKDEENNPATSQFTQVFPLYTSTLTSWTRNQYVRYIINLSPNLITFNPVVTEDWSTNPDVNQNN
ncbi:MAG: fimbrillin family protein [Bacteroidales bacterium]|nr:fimbrillin family protein [Bacteroidales bacterium]